MRLRILGSVDGPSRRRMVYLRGVSSGRVRFVGDAAVEVAGGYAWPISAGADFDVGRPAG